MSDWTLIVGVFWLLYLVECVHLRRRARFWVAGGGRVVHGLAGLAPVAAWGRQVEAEDPPLALSPEGMSNVPAGSAGRPAPMPERAACWRWEEVAQLGEKEGWIHVNGSRFCRVTPLTTLAAVRALVDGAKVRAGAEREVWLRARVRGWFGAGKLARQWRRLAGRTGFLAVAVGYEMVLLLGASVYLLAGDRLGLSAVASERLGRLAAAAGWALPALHVATVVAGGWAHARLRPGARAERAGLIFGALFYPPQALRLRDRLAKAYLSRGAHPLAWIAAAGGAEAFRVHARQALADVDWPARAGRGNEKLALAIGSWMRAAVRAEVVRLIRERGLDEAELLAAPEADGPGSCAYCPRCGSQFTSMDGVCPQGVALKAVRGKGEGRRAKGEG